jgi:hypothetical protein
MATSSVSPRHAKQAQTDGSDGDGDSGTGNNEYGTPIWLIKRLQVYLPGGLFDRDVAAGAEGTQIARNRWTKEDDALAQPEWAGPQIDSLLCNPPYGGKIGPEPFLRRLADAVDPDDPTKADFAVSITRSDTTTEWFHEHLGEATALWFHDDRFEFISPDASGDAGFACTVALFGEIPDGLLADLARDGQIYSQDEIEPANPQPTLDTFGSDDTDKPGVPVVTTAETATTDLSYARPSDYVHIELQENGLIGTLPEEMTLQILPEGCAPNDGGTGVELDAIGVTDDGDDICAHLVSGDSIPTEVSLTIAVGMDGWRAAMPTEVRITRSGDTPRHFHQEVLRGDPTETSLPDRLSPS